MESLKLQLLVNFATVNDDCLFDFSPAFVWHFIWHIERYGLHFTNVPRKLIQASCIVVLLISGVWTLSFYNFLFREFDFGPSYLLKQALDGSAIFVGKLNPCE